MSSVLDTPAPPPAPQQARTVKLMGDDDMPATKKRIGRPPGSKNKPPEPKKKRRRRRRSGYGEIADRLAAKPNGNTAATLARSTFSILEAVLDLDGCDPLARSAWDAHKAALELLAA